MSVQIRKETVFGKVTLYELSVEVSNGDQFQVEAFKDETQTKVTRVRLYDSERSRLFLRYARKNKSRAEAERLAIEFLRRKDVVEE